MPDSTVVHEGSCACGAVKVAAEGDPAVSGYCHCESCRRWHTAPVNAWAGWVADAVTVTQGEDQILEYDNSKQGGGSIRGACRLCGSGVLNRTRSGFTVVYPSALFGTDYVHQPTAHIYYRERVLDMQDGLPKFADLPAELGGSGEMIEEPPRTGPALQQN